MPTTRLNRHSVVTDVPSLKVIPRNRQLRQGKFIYHARAYDTEAFDDWTIDGSYILVGALGVVETREKRLFVLNCHGPSTPSELFHAVIAEDGADNDYLYHVLRNTASLHVIEGTNIVQQIPIGKLEALCIPWPDKYLRSSFVSLMEQFHRMGAAVGSSSAKQALNESRLLAATCFLNCTRYPDNLAIDSEEIASSRIFDSDDAHHLPQDASDNVLDIIEYIIENLIHNGEAPFDVVAATNDLEHQGTGAAASLCVCFPPPNQIDWAKDALLEEDARWILGTPPRNRANFAWIMQTIDAMDSQGKAVLLLCNAPLTSELGCEGSLRHELIDANLVSCIVSLPGGLFADERPPSSILVLDKNKSDERTLLLDAQDMGEYMGRYEDGAIKRRIPNDRIEEIAHVIETWLVKGKPVDGNHAVTVDKECLLSRNSLAPWLHLPSQ